MTREATMVTTCRTPIERDSIRADHQLTERFQSLERPTIPGHSQCRRGAR
jgi:hypothetical protein